MKQDIMIYLRYETYMAFDGKDIRKATDEEVAEYKAIRANIKNVSRENQFIGSDWS